MDNSQQLSISVVMPAYNAVNLLPKVLTPLMEMLASGEVQEVIVVDDQSPDATAAEARKMGATVLTTPVNGGPGAARNLAAEQARGDILWFVDSDVIAWPGGAAKIRAAFAEDGVDAVFGSYDTTPAGTPWFSRYKNLMHRFYHQHANRDSTTFWAGCGAVRADVFRKIGGFDVETYKVPSIEDIELGYRVRSNGGRIVVVPDLLGKHLKVWTVRNGIHTDIFRRALPWSRLMIAREGLTNDLNTSTGERVKAVVAGLLLLSVLGLVVAPSIWPWTLGLLALAFALNWSLFQFFRENGGAWFALKAVLYHQLYYVYSAGAFAWCLFEYHILGRKDRLHVP
ncbi:MAG: glycosyltransferase [Pseudomonadota bacterium]|jgi:glycosyltransferase involved in cell wall biosynthesis|nr:glycosyltransferase [Pseudomonadota bacterium]